MSGPYCGDCGNMLTEYLGLYGKPGEGEWYCKACEQSDGVPIEVDPDEDITPHRGISWPPDWDFGSD
jgi:hypothetical protein